MSMFPAHFDFDFYVFVVFSFALPKEKDRALPLHEFIEYETI